MKSINLILLVGIAFSTSAAAFSVGEIGPNGSSTLIYSEGKNVVIRVCPELTVLGKDNKSAAAACKAKSETVISRDKFEEALKTKFVQDIGGYKSTGLYADEAAKLKKLSDYAKAYCPNFNRTLACPAMSAEQVKDLRSLSGRVAAFPRSIQENKAKEAKVKNKVDQFMNEISASALTIDQQSKWKLPTDFLANLGKDPVKNIPKVDPNNSNAMGSQPLQYYGTCSVKWYFQPYSDSTGDHYTVFYTVKNLETGFEQEGDQTVKPSLKVNVQKAMKTLNCTQASSRPTLDSTLNQLAKVNTKACQ